MDEGETVQAGAAVPGGNACHRDNGVDPVRGVRGNGCRKMSFFYTATHGRGARTA